MEMTEARARLPNRRHAELTDVAFDSMNYCLTIGRFDNGRPAEVFIDCMTTDRGKGANTSTLAMLCRDASIITSIALQHGVPLETLRAGITRLDHDDPATIIGRALDEMSEADGNVRPPPTNA